MKLYEIKSSDYEIIAKWWEKRGKTVPNSDFYAGVSGFGIIEDSELLAAVFAYKASKYVGQLGFMATNPKADKTKRLEALYWSMKYATDYLKSEGIRYIQIATDSATITRLGQDLGYQALNATHFLMYSEDRS